MNDLIKIINDYGKILAELPQDEMLHPESLLPYPKETIRQCLSEALDVAQDKEQKDQLTTGLMFLNDFIPDDELPDDPIERIALFAKLNK